MYGIVEIYLDDKLVCQERNTIMDGAAKTICDIFTISPSLSGISSASAILDTSNYTIQALSFGKDQLTFSSNAHASAGLIAYGKSTSSQVWGEVSAAGVSSYTPTVGLPRYPNPVENYLDIPHYPISSTLTSGNIPNLLPYYQYIAEVSGLALSSILGIGCFPYASGNLVQLRTGASPGTFVASTVLSSTFNAISSMDYRGFVNRTTTTNPVSGLVGSSTTTFSGTGEIIYHLTVPSGDLGFVNLYGGIYNIGLWTIDVKETLKTASPPFTFHAVNNPRKYRLFAKKSFLQNLAKISDNGTNPGIINYKNLNIIWRLFFV